MASFIVKGVFAVAMKACPYRADFYAKLGSPIETVEAELAKWLAALDKIIAQIEAFYEKVRCSALHPGRAPRSRFD